MCAANSQAHLTVFKHSSAFYGWFGQQEHLTGTFTERIPLLCPKSQMSSNNRDTDNTSGREKFAETGEE